MPEAFVTSATSFSIERSLDAPIEKVFSAFTEVTILKRWWGPEGFTTPSAEVDARPGGKYRIAMQPPEGETVYVFGTFVEVDKPRKLVYTWAWDEDEGPSHESLVTIELTAHGDQTHLLLTQTRLENEKSRDGHIEGWTSALGRLPALFQRSSVA